MDRRLALQTKLEEILGSENVYYNPPSNKRMNYEAIRYTLNDIERRSADNLAYFRMHCYQITYIGYTLKDDIKEKLMDLPYASFERSYKADNLDHYIVNIYW